jgi:hypothetical protein
MALDLLGGNAHLLRDLAVGEAFPPAEQQHLALNRFQLRDGPFPGATTSLPLTPERFLPVA